MVQKETWHGDAEHGSILQSAAADVRRLLQDALPPAANQPTISANHHQHQQKYSAAAAATTSLKTYLNKGDGEYKNKLVDMQVCTLLSAYLGQRCWYHKIVTAKRTPGMTWTQINRSPKPTLTLTLNETFSSVAQVPPFHRTYFVKIGWVSSLANKKKETNADSFIHSFADGNIASLAEVIKA